MSDNGQWGTHQQEKAIESLRDSAKWVVGLSFASATGCVVTLKDVALPELKRWLIVAILFFALSTLTGSAPMLGVDDRNFPLGRSSFAAASAVERALRG